MAEKAYQNREMDAKFEEVHKRLDSQDTTLERIEKKQDFTNGKVKKIIIALAVIVGVYIGSQGESLLPVLIKLFI